MDIFSDPVLLARLQFACTAAYHFIFVPLTIGLGLILAINETRYYRSRDPKDAAATKFWVKIFTATFVLGLATGITMEFSFGTNWADYSRFVATSSVRRWPPRRCSRSSWSPRSWACCCSGAGACRRSSTWCRPGSCGSARLCRPCGSSLRTRGCRPRPARSCPPTARRPSSPTS